MIRALLVCLLCAGAAAADGFPALHDVVDVAANDALNVRAGPGTSNPIIAALPPDAKGIEVVTTRDGWGRVNIQDQSGWVSMRFLTLTDTPSVPRICFGTEPFWRLDIGGVQSSFERLGDASQSFDTRTLTPSSSRPDQAGITLEGTGKLHGIYTARQCSDGMSDRLYGISIDLILSPDGGIRQVYSGCCSVSPD